MASIRIGRVPRVVVAATAVATAAPSGASNTFEVESDTFRLFLQYAAAATCSLRLWIKNEVTGVFYRGEDVTTLTPANGNEALTFDVPGGGESYIQVTAVTGGTVTLSVAQE